MVRADVRVEVEGCIASEQRLVAELVAIGDDLDPRRPSLLPGWTVGHVLTHLARNADSHVEMLAGRPQYASAEERDAGIEAGALRSAADLVDDVAASSRRLAERWLSGLDSGEIDVAGTAQRVGRTVSVAMLPMLRWREVEVHRVDLGIGPTMSDLDRGYLRRDLRLLEMLWRARRPMGLTPLPEAVRRLAPHERLGWFLGRVHVDGVEPAGPV
jgi:maleylpyruvate isomerase